MSAYDQCWVWQWPIVAGRYSLAWFLGAVWICGHSACDDVECNYNEGPPGLHRAFLAMARVEWGEA